jgi:hypothetical protein
MTAVATRTTLISPQGAGAAGGDAGTITRRRDGWWRRWRERRATRPSWEQELHAHLERVLAVLETAREQLAAGWVEGGWWSVRTESGPVLVGGLAAGLRQDPGPVEGACLVGALVRAGKLHPGARDQVGAAIDAVYDAMWERRGQAAPGQVVVSSPQVRAAHVRELTRWNDRPGRTLEEVLAVLDRAIASTLMRVVSLPGPAAVRPDVVVPS